MVLPGSAAAAGDEEVTAFVAVAAAAAGGETVAPGFDTASSSSGTSHSASATSFSEDEGESPAPGGVQLHKPVSGEQTESSGQLRLLGSGLELHMTWSHISPAHPKWHLHDAASRYAYQGVTSTAALHRSSSS